MPTIKYHFYSAPKLEKTIYIDTDSLSVADLKVAIAKNEEIGRAKFDFKIINSSSRSKEAYKSDLTMVPANSVLTIKRVPAAKVMIDTSEMDTSASGAPLLASATDFTDDASAISRIAMAEAARYNDRKAIEMSRNRMERYERNAAVKEEINNDVPLYAPDDPLPNLVEKIPNIDSFRHGPLWQKDLKQFLQAPVESTRKSTHSNSSRRAPKNKRRRDF